MKLFTRDKGLRASLESEASCRRHYAADMCRKILLRLTALKAADSLAVFWPPKSGPERCHELKGSDAGVFSMDVKQPYRLLFEPLEAEESGETAEAEESDKAEEPIDRSEERARWQRIRSVELLRIEDTHG